MKVIYLHSIILLFLQPLGVKADPIDNIMHMLRQGNTYELSKLFSDNVEVTVLDSDNSLDKATAVPALDKFFADNKPKSVRLFHKIDSNPNYLFGVVFLNTDKGLYRIALTLDKHGTEMKIVEMRIEVEKTK
ncbi:DUF4783 domain-containing protein [Mucilaginibacter sp. E4BP6]|uniref:DUF4783 domain-containing protein n=1 Tax=Mucilaginibacter sp. E4BP6 TaxID=2723089 RepID=UPI0015C6CC84|nr:DUF4783 domain-containing protein [Mucilaginibacter sp. E4BP6]NYE67120.1 hypothetical protein [Mucilaginibacter sp. E4BP6]